MENIQKIRSAHRKAVAEGSLLSLKAFARECGARDDVDYIDVIRMAHRRAHTARSAKKREATRAAIASRRANKKK